MSYKPTYDRDGATRWYEKGHQGYFLKDFLDFDSRIPIIKTWVSEKITSGGKMADIGCGDMSLANLMPSLNWSGFDLDPKKDPRIIKQDIAAVPYNCAPGTYDGLVCSEVLEHVFNPHEVISEFNRILKLNGWAIITVPNFDSIEFYLGHHEQLLFDTSKFWTLEHIRWYNSQNLAKLLNERGFKIWQTIGSAQCFSGIMSYAQTAIRDYMKTKGIEMNLAEAGRVVGLAFPNYSPGISMLCQKVLG